MTSAIWESSGPRPNDLPSRKKFPGQALPVASQVLEVILHFDSSLPSGKRSMSGFLYEFKVHEILHGVESRCDSVLSIQSKVVSADDAADLLEATFKSSVEDQTVEVSGGQTVDSSVLSIRSDCSDSDDEPLAAFVSRLNKAEKRKRIKPPMTESQRKRQKVYDKTSRVNKELKRKAMADKFVAGLKVLNLMLLVQIEKTRKITLTRRLTKSDNKKEGASAYQNDLQTIEEEGRKQLQLNHVAMLSIDFWDLTWKQNTAEYGNYFLKQWATRIETLIESLVTFGKRLTEETVELEFCIAQKPEGVWI